MKKLLRFIPGIATFAIGAGLEISDYKNAHLGWSLIGVGALLFLLPAISWLRRVRVRFFLVPEPSAGPRVSREHEMLTPASPTRALSAGQPKSTDTQQRQEKELVRLERLLRPLPASHLALLRALSSGPKRVPFKSEAKDSLIQLKLIRYVGQVDSSEGLFEANSEHALAEYFRRKRAKELPALLAGLSPEERRFLSLFQCEQSLQERADSTTRLLPNSVYSARRSLAQKELLRLCGTQGHFETLALPEDVVPLLSEYLGSPALQTQVQLDLRTVATDSGGGSGAPAFRPRSV